jgi:hypothetical protein
MITPEKNDVEISKLFTWGKEAIIVDSDDKEVLKYYIRILGDADLGRSRVYALRKSAELRKKLNDLETDERIGFIIDETSVGKEQLVQIILTIRVKDFTSDVQKEINIPFPREPKSDAPLKVQEEYQQAIDSFPSRVQEAIHAEVTKRMENEQKRLMAFTKKELYDMYVDFTINDICEREMFSKFKNHCILLGCYKDSEYKEKLFKDMDEILALPEPIKNQFIDEYSGLEMSMDFLRQSPEVTPL